MRRFENDTFESVIFKSVEMESVVVSAHPLTVFLWYLNCQNQTLCDDVAHYYQWYCFLFTWDIHQRMAFF